MEDKTNHVQPEHQNQRTRKRLPWAAIARIFLGFSFIVLIVAFFAVAYHYLSTGVATSQRLQENVAVLQQKVTETNQRIEQLMSDFKNQEQVINSLRQTQTGYNRDEWRVVEAEFLVKLANDKIQLEQNIPQAIMLLQAADNAIRDLNNEHMLSLRKALAADVAALQALPQVDISGLYLRMSALNDQMHQLPLIIKHPENNAESKNTVQPAVWWKRGLQDTWQAIKQIVVIRYNKSDVPPLLSPEQQDFIYQNLHAIMEKAMWGLLHQNPTIYRMSLQQAAQWIKQYFVTDVPATRNALTQIEQLQQVDIHPNVPNALSSLAAFREFFAMQNPQNT